MKKKKTTPEIGSPRMGPRLKRWTAAYNQLSDFDKEKERELWREAKLKAIQEDEREASNNSSSLQKS